MTTTESKYKWNKDTLKEAYNKLFFKEDRTEEEENELHFLECILDNSVTLDGMSFVDDIEFAEAFDEEAKTLMSDYTQYLSFIFDFYDNADPDIEQEKFEGFLFSEDDILASVHDFYYKLDKTWFNYFINIFKDRKDNLSFDKSRSFSHYFPKSDIWLANINRTYSIGDYVDGVHEYAHGIADQITGKIKVYSPNNILIEVFPIVCQLIYLYKNDLRGMQPEVSKYINNYYATMINYAEEIKTKYNIAATFFHVKNPRNLSRLIKKAWNLSLKKEDIVSLYATPIEENINYVFPFLVAVELLELYTLDPELFKYTANKIITSDKDPLSLLDDLYIEPNRHLWQKKITD